MSTRAHITAASSWPAGTGTPASCHTFGTLEMPNSVCALRGDLPEDVYLVPAVTSLCCPGMGQAISRATYLNVVFLVEKVWWMQLKYFYSQNS